MNVISSDDSTKNNVNHVCGWTFLLHWKNRRIISAAKIVSKWDVNGILIVRIDQILTQWLKTLHNYNYSNIIDERTCVSRFYDSYSLS